VYILPFKQLNKGDSSIAGGKGASLGEMINIGMPVPDGFVVVADAFDNFAKSINLNMEIGRQFEVVKLDDLTSIKNASRVIQSLIINTEMSKDVSEATLEAFDGLNCSEVAVRSSATAEDGADVAWAGQLESYMNVEKEALLQSVKLCWASLFSERAIAYRFKNRLENTDVSVAVIVQKMIHSEVAGVAFSVHPVTKESNHIVIEAAKGLGEAVASGEVIPDRYIIQKDTLTIIESNIQQDALLPDGHLLELARLVKNIEDYYGFPVDVEWALEKENIYILQSRPITTL
jgi:pyruvate, water dikinase